MAETRLAPMTAAYLEQVLEIEQASFTNPWTRVMFEGELNRGAVSRGWVLLDGRDRVCGYCLGWLVEGELHISNLAVAPAVRRLGLGHRMLSLVLAEVAAGGARSATLEVRRTNQAAVKLYQRLGFRVMGIRPRYYTNPIEDALILWLAHLPGQP